MLICKDLIAPPSDPKSGYILLREWFPEKILGMTYQERLEKFLGAAPQVDPTAWIAKSAEVMGDVRIGPHASVFYQTVLRGDLEKIIIGEGTNIQDGAIIHMEVDLPVIIGHHVTVGHGAMIHACTIEDECLIGMRSIILDGAVIGRRSIVAAGALVPPGMKVPPGSMAMGLPARVIGLDPQRQRAIRQGAEHYMIVSADHRRRYGGKNL